MRTTFQRLFVCASSRRFRERAPGSSSLFRLASLSITTLLLWVAITPFSVQAQGRIENVLQPGARVRYKIPRASRPFTGIVERIDSAGLLVRPDGITTSIHLGADSLRSLALSAGVRSPSDGAVRGAWAGLRIGFVLGVLITTAVWLSPADERCDDCFIGATVAVAQVSMVGAFGLGLLGGLIGAASPGEMWLDIPINSLHNEKRR